MKIRLSLSPFAVKQLGGTIARSLFRGSTSYTD